MSYVRILSRIVSTLVLLSSAMLHAQSDDNPYHAQYDWVKMPEGRKIGVPSGVFPDPERQHIWVLSRCGENHCALHPEVDPILKFDLDGNVVDSFSAGLFSWPHGFFLDHEGFLWVTEGAPVGDERLVEGTKRGLGHQVFKLNQADLSPAAAILAVSMIRTGSPSTSRAALSSPIVATTVRRSSIRMAGC